MSAAPTPGRWLTYAAAGDLSRYVEAAGFAFLAIRQAAQLVAMPELAGSTAESRLEGLLKVVNAELAKVDAILPREEA